MCMKYIVVWGFPSQINFKENVAFNRNYSNSCKNRYGSHHWEGLKALLSTTRIKRECVILLFLFCSRLYLVVLVYDHFWMNCSIKKIYIYMNNWTSDDYFYFSLMPWPVGGKERAKGVAKLVLFNRIFIFVPHKLKTSGVRHHPKASLLRTIGREISELKYHSWPWF